MPFEERRRRALECREIDRETARRDARIGSAYSTEVVYRLERTESETSVGWTLREERLSRPVEKIYDDGDLDEWTESYVEGGSAPLRFLAAYDGPAIAGILTWREERWNDTLWLLDIRTRATSRRQGIGTELVENLKGACKALGGRGILVETQTNNGPAIRFYRKQGFRFAGLNDHLYSNEDVENGDTAVYLFWESA
jgi:ribosomal protein S18 acetylase RimI-like enzyme